MENVALLVIDMQADFLEVPCKYTKQPRSGVKSQVAAINTVLHAGVELKLPIVVVEYIEHGPTLREINNITADPDFVATRIFPNSFVRYKMNSPPGRFPDSVKVVYKRFDNAFRKTGLERLLGEYSASKVVMMGVNSSVCVEETAQAALWRGFEVVTSPDLLSDCCRWTLKKSLEFYDSRTNLMLGSSEVVSYLRSNAPVPALSR